MYIHKAVLVAAVAVSLLLAGWAGALATGRNPLPVPDRHYQAFTAASAEAMHALVDVFAQHGRPPRFRYDSEAVERAILWDGTIINVTEPALSERLGHPGSVAGFVVADPVASARDAVRVLRSRGFRAEEIEEPEPGSPIAFVTTDALTSAVLAFRPHVLRLRVQTEPWD
jgi:hypothetical protein